MSKIVDPAKLEPKPDHGYPPPFGARCKGRERKALGLAAGLTEFGVNLLRLPPGVWSSERHWHKRGDEFVYVLSGEVTLVTDSGEEILRAGQAAGFTANDGDGHQLQNRTNAEALVLEIGSRPAEDAVHYSDIDFVAIRTASGWRNTRRDGTPL